MRAKVSLVARVNDGTQTFPRVAVKIARRSIVLPVERKDGRMFGLSDIIGFYVRYWDSGKRRIETLGKDPIAAYTRFLQIEQDFSRVRAGLLPINDKPAPEPIEIKDDRSLRACAKEFIANSVTLGKKKATVDAYTRAANGLAAQFPTKAIDDIDKKDMLAHLSHLRMTLKKRGDGDSQFTIRNRLRNLRVFFGAFGVTNPLQMREVKKPVKKRPTRYSIEMINKMLEVADDNQKDLIHFLLETGFRDEETAYAKWTDIDFEQHSINVHPKPEYGWSPKDGEAREEDIVLQDRFIKRMKARQKRQVGSTLIFPTETNKPNMHLIKIVQRVAKKAGITDKRITLHAFRRTFGTMVAKEYGIEQARIWLGHSDIETTQRYMAADEMTTEHSRKMVKKMFAGVGD
jgi:integrase